MQQTGKRIITIMILVAVLCCTFLYSSAESPAENAVLHLEAEDGTFFGNVKAKQSSGTGWVEGFRSAGDSFQLLLSVEKDGSYGYWGVGYGGRMPYNDRYSYGNNNMNMGGRGNYAYDDGYSRMSSSDKMMNELQMMMDESTSARDKAIIQRALDELKK